MICPVEYWIWLQRTLGPGKSLCDLMSFFGNPEKIYEAGRKNLLNSGIINKKTADALAMFSPSESYTVMKQCENNGWKIITFEDECYPPLLKTIGNYPVVLYVAGDENVLKRALRMLIDEFSVTTDITTEEQLLRVLDGSGTCESREILESIGKSK